MMKSPAVAFRDGLPTVDNAETARPGPTAGEGEIMPSSSAPVPQLPSTAEGRDSGVHGEFGDGEIGVASGQWPVKKRIARRGEGCENVTNEAKLLSTQGPLRRQVTSTDCNCEDDERTQF